MDFIERIIVPTPQIPQIQKLTLENGYELSVMVIDINESEYDECVLFADHMWANKKKGAYGEGLRNTKEDPRKTERTGNLGEMAFAKLIHSSVDFRYIENGKMDRDFEIENTIIELKTAMRNYGAGLKKYRGESTTAIPHMLIADLYVFAFINFDDRERRRASISFVGWTDKKTYWKYRDKPSRTSQSNHRNYDIPYHDLNTIQTFLFLPTLRTIET